MALTIAFGNCNNFRWFFHCSIVRLLLLLLMHVACCCWPCVRWGETIPLFSSAHRTRTLFLPFHWFTIHFSLCPVRRLCFPLSVSLSLHLSFSLSLPVHSICCERSPGRLHTMYSQLSRLYLWVRGANNWNYYIEKCIRYHCHMLAFYMC